MVEGGTVTKLYAWAVIQVELLIYIPTPFISRQNSRPSGADFKKMPSFQMEAV